MKLFGTDGIRARAGAFPLNAAAIPAIGRAVGERLGGPLLVGQDTRVSSPWILDLLESGFRQAGIVSENAGVIPTPAIALLTRSGSLRGPYSGGVMISASHNAYRDNGIKVFSSDGTKLTDTAEREVEARILQLLPAGADQNSDAVPTMTFSENGNLYRERYEELLISHFPPGTWLTGRRILVDCANGAMSAVAPELLKRLGADVEVICANPNGKNINEKCGAVHLKTLVDAMKKRTSFDFGVAFDGDGDRSLFVSGRGRLVDGDAVLLVLARRHAPSSVVGTSMTNFALEQALRSQNIGLTRVAVGDRYIFEEMQRSGALLGGEPSGHIIFADFRLSGDGLLTTLKLAQTMVETGKSLDDLTSEWVPAPHLLEGVPVSQKVPVEEMVALQSVMRDANAELEGCGRLVVRYSGTEDVLRVMIESDDAERNEIWMKKLLHAIDEDIKNPG